jgi:hypothetical protein
MKINKPQDLCNSNNKTIVCPLNTGTVNFVAETFTDYRERRRDEIVIRVVPELRPILFPLLLPCVMADNSFCCGLFE